MHLETSADHANTKKVRGLRSECRPAILERFCQLFRLSLFILHRIPASVELLEVSFRPVNLNENLRYHCYSFSFFQIGKDKTKEERGDAVTDGPSRSYCSFPNGFGLCQAAGLSAVVKRMTGDSPLPRARLSPISLSTCSLSGNRFGTWY